MCLDLHHIQIQAANTLIYSVNTENKKKYGVGCPANSHENRLFQVFLSLNKTGWSKSAILHIIFKKP